MRWLLFMVISLFAGIAPITAQDETPQILENALADFAEADGPAAVVQITTTDGSWSAAAGLADGKRYAAPNDRFRIGSMSKTFVAVTALLLQEAGIFDLDDLAANWLPDEVLENIANADTVTVRQLLAMRSGIDDYLAQDEFWAALEADPTYIWTAQEALQYAYGLPALAAPDEEFYYSNSNYLLLQLVLESASGLPLHSLMRDRILDPLRLSDTYTQISETLPGGFVDGYEDFDGDGKAENVSDFNDGAGLADGGLISNVNDLTTFYRALLVDQTLLTADSMDELLAFQPADGEGYSLGLGEWATDYGTAWGHSGSVLGFVSMGFYLPEQDAIIIALSASADIDPDEIALSAAEAILAEN